MSVEVNETIETVKRMANMYIEEMYMGVLTLNMYTAQSDNLNCMVSEVGRNYVYLNTNPFYKWLLDQPLSDERTTALAFMSQYTFIKKLDRINILRSSIINRPIPLSFHKRIIVNGCIMEHNTMSSTWISNYIKTNTTYICDYIKVGNVDLK